MNSQPTLANLQAEAAVLGSILIDGQLIYRIKTILQPDDFTDVRHREIYQAMLVMAKDDRIIDLLTLTDHLEAHDALRRAGEPGYLTELVLEPPTYVHAEHYATIVGRLAQRRELLATAQETASKAFEANDMATVLPAVRARLAKIEQMGQGGNEGINLPQSVTAYLDLLERRDADRDKPQIAFLWHDLADLMPYLDGGVLVGVLAESGVGKTAFLENCAEHWACSGWRVMFFHFELSTNMMLDRRMQRATGIPIKRLQTGGKLLDEDYPAILAASEKMNVWSGNIQYVHCPGWTMAQVVTSIRQAHELWGVDIASVDYLNKIKLVDRHGLNSAQLRGQDIEDFKVCLEELGIVGLMAAQFDKASKGMHIRTLANARDTGELEDKANVGIVIDRPRDDNGQRTSNARVSVVKCNAGQEGICNLYFQGERFTFQSVSRSPVDAPLDEPWQDR